MDNSNTLKWVLGYLNEIILLLLFSEVLISTKAGTQ